ncbi:MAG: nitroreductase family protein [Lentisphaeria bacterium]
MTNHYLEALSLRRTCYALTDEATISNEKIQELISNALKHTPTSFNSQSSRVVLLLKNHHHKLWKIVLQSLKNILSDEQFAQSSQKIASFSAAYGTVLFYEDQNVIENFQKLFPTYSSNFPIWSNQSSGMLQHAIWTLLELENFGASLQHYSELIHEQVQEEWQIPKNWKLIAQMPFGKISAPPQTKEFLPIPPRFYTFD